MPHGITCAIRCTQNSDASHAPRELERSREKTWLAALRYSREVLGLPIAFSTSLEGSGMDMKPAAPVPVDTAGRLKA